MGQASSHGLHLRSLVRSAHRSGRPRGCRHLQGLRSSGGWSSKRRSSRGPFGIPGSLVVLVRCSLGAHEGFGQFPSQSVIASQRLAASLVMSTAVRATKNCHVSRHQDPPSSPEPSKSHSRCAARPYAGDRVIASPPLSGGPSNRWRPVPRTSITPSSHHISFHQHHPELHLLRPCRGPQGIALRVPLRFGPGRR
jgi:hypothetical protein